MVDLSQLIPAKGRRFLVFRPPAFPHRLESRYRRLVLNELKVLFEDILETILPHVKARHNEFRSQDAVVQVMDEDELDSFFFTIQENENVRDVQLSSRLQTLFTQEVDRHDEAYFKALRKITEIDLRRLTQADDLRPIVENRLSENVSLIKSLKRDQLTRVQSMIRENKVSGQSFAGLMQDIRHQFNVSTSRARLIARDQAAKLSSDINQIRQEQMGVKKYRWSTSKDERVRERHQRLDGKVYTWGKKTGAEGGLSPGKPIQCRCVAMAIIEFKGVASGVKEGEAIKEARGYDLSPEYLRERAALNSVVPNTPLEKLTFTATDGGAQAAGFVSENDCVARAIHFGTGKSYRQIRRDLNLINRSLGRGSVGRAGVTPRAYIPYLERHGFRRIDVSDQGMTMLEAYNTYGDVIVRTDGHMATILDGHLLDSFNSEFDSIVRTVYVKAGRRQARTILPTRAVILNVEQIELTAPIAVKLPWIQINKALKLLGLDLNLRAVPIPTAVQMETKRSKWRTRDHEEQLPTVIRKETWKTYALTSLKDSGHTLKSAHAALTKIFNSHQYRRIFYDVLDTQDLLMRRDMAEMTSIFSSQRFKNPYEVREFDRTKYGRHNVEERLHGLAADTPLDQYPKYGYFDDLQNMKYNETTKFFGDLIIKFKDHVKAQSTFTIGDSYAVEAVATPPAARSLYPLIRFMTDGFEEARRHFLKTKDLRNIHPSYIEAQIHGLLSIDDIDTIFYSTVAERDQLRLLIGQRDIQLKPRPGLKIPQSEEPALPAQTLELPIPITKRTWEPYVTNNRKFDDKELHRRSIKVFRSKEYFQAFKDELDKTSIYMRIYKNQLLRAIKMRRFLNAFEVDTKSETYMKFREPTESSIFGMTKDTPGFDRPKYGYLDNDKQNISGAPLTLDSYGNLVVKFRDDVKIRSTFTINDSFEGGLPSPILSPQLYSLNSLQDLLFPGPQPNQFMMTRDLRHMNDQYFEVQMFGKLTLDDVETIWYTLEDERNALRQLLVTHPHIKLRIRPGYERVLFPKTRVNIPQPEEFDVPALAGLQKVPEVIQTQSYRTTRDRLIVKAHGSLAAYSKKLDAYFDKFPMGGSRRLDYFDEFRKDLDETDIYMRVPLKHLRSIFHDGEFRSTHETGLGLGAKSGDMLDARKRFEHTTFGVNTDAPLSEYPKYGYLDDDDEFFSEPDRMSDLYGSIRVKFKDHMKDRSTFTINDSFDKVNSERLIAAPSSPRNPSKTALELVLNYKYRKLKGPDATSPEGKYGGFWRLHDFKHQHGYNEVQMFGRVTLDDIDTIFYSTHAEYTELRRLIGQRDIHLKPRPGLAPHPEESDRPAFGPEKKVPDVIKKRGFLPEFKRLVNSVYKDSANPDATFELQLIQNFGRKDYLDIYREALDNTHVMMRVEFDTLKGISTRGRFLNIFENEDAATDKGIDYIKHREVTEEKIFGLRPDSDPAVRPKYAYLETDSHTLASEGMLHSYGPIIVQFDDRIKAQTTYSLGDSMDVKGALPAPVQGQWRTALWKFHDPAKAADTLNFIKSRNLRYLIDYDYFEAQIHGEVTLKDVKKLIFMNPSDEGRLRKLVANNKDFAHIEVVPSPHALRIRKEHDEVSAKRKAELERLHKLGKGSVVMTKKRYKAFGDRHLGVDKSDLPRADAVREQLRKDLATTFRTDTYKQMIAKDLEKTHIYMRIQPKALYGVVGDNKFKTAYHPGTFPSAGAMSDEQKRLEHRVFGVPEKSAIDQHPKYGYVDNDEQTTNEARSLDGYGPITLRFKDDVKVRSTLTWSDSIREGPATDFYDIEDASLVHVRDFAFSASHAATYSKTRDLGRLKTGEFIEAQIYGHLDLDDVDTIFVESVKDMNNIRELMRGRAIEIKTAVRDSRLDLLKDPKTTANAYFRLLTSDDLDVMPDEIVQRFYYEFTHHDMRKDMAFLMDKDPDFFADHFQYADDWDSYVTSDERRAFLKEFLLPVVQERLRELDRSTRSGIWPLINNDNSLADDVLNKALLKQ